MRSSFKFVRPFSVLVIAGVTAQAAHVAAAEGEPPFPVHYKPSIGFSTYYRTACTQRENTGETSWNRWGSDTATIWSWGNWECNGSCATSPGGYATSQFNLSYYRSPYQEHNGEFYSYGGRCETNDKSLFSGDGTARARLFIHSNVSSSTGVFSLVMMPSGDFNPHFELDLIVVNEKKNSVKVVNFGEPLGNSANVPLSELIGRWVDVQVDIDTKSSSSQNWGSASSPVLESVEDFENGVGRDTGKCRYTIWRDGLLYTGPITTPTSFEDRSTDDGDFKVTSCDIGPAAPWWMRMADGRLKSGPGGVHFVANARARDYDQSLVTVPGGIDYSLDRGFVTVEWISWEPADHSF
jgi:hypothetical protein